MKIIKLGGSVFSDKTAPNSLHNAILSNFISQIVHASRMINESVILVHGGGSFGHPPASIYGIQNGLSADIPDQVYGLGLTQRRMISLNEIISDLFLELKFPTVTLQTSSLFVKKDGNLKFHGIDHIESLLKMKIMPILYGDIILDAAGNFSILSGDDIILSLCQNLDKYQVNEVIFCTDKDGILVPGSENRDEIMSEVQLDSLEGLNFTEKSANIDVTGGIHHKIEIIQQISKFCATIIMVNGKKEHLVYQALLGEEVPSTKFIF